VAAQFQLSFQEPQWAALDAAVGVAGASSQVGGHFAFWGSPSGSPWGSPWGGGALCVFETPLFSASSLCVLRRCATRARACVFHWQVEALLRGMLAVEPAARWNASECLRHPFFSGDLFGRAFDPTASSPRQKSARGGSQPASSSSSSSSSSSGIGNSLSGIEGRGLQRPRSSCKARALGRCISNPHLQPPPPLGSTNPPRAAESPSSRRGAVVSFVDDNHANLDFSASESDRISSGGRSSSSRRQAAGTQAGWQSPGRQAAPLAAAAIEGGCSLGFSDSEGESSDEEGEHEAKTSSRLSPPQSPLRHGLPKDKHELSKTY
jgi:hypothetical protein